MKNHFIRIYLG